MPFSAAGWKRPRAEEIAKPFAVQAQSMGLRAGIDLDDISGLLDFLDGPARR